MLITWHEKVCNHPPKTGTPFGKTSKCIILIEKVHLVTGIVSLDIEFEYSHLPA